MSDLVVLAFETQGGAAGMLSEIERLQKMQLLTLDDAATSSATRMANRR